MSITKYTSIKSEIKFWLEMVGIIAGIGVLVLLWKQYKEMVKTTTVAIGQLDAMRGQLNEMKRAPQLDERAWVSPFEMMVENSSVRTNYSFFKLKFKNTGKTPALNVSVCHEIAYGYNEVPTNDPPIQTNSMLLAPDGVSFISSNIIDNNQMRSLREGGLNLCFYGKITYDDIFGNHHWTQFCWSMESDFGLRPSPIHNSCDEAIQNTPPQKP